MVVYKNFSKVPCVTKYMFLQSFISIQVILLLTLNTYDNFFFVILSKMIFV